MAQKQTTLPSPILKLLDDKPVLSTSNLPTWKVVNRLLRRDFHVGPYLRPRMDVKGQYRCERYFMILMWIATAISFALGLAFDSVHLMFRTFAGSLLICAVLCLPEWPMFNRSPLQFRTSESAVDE